LISGLHESELRLPSGESEPIRTEQKDTDRGHALIERARSLEGRWVLVYRYNERKTDSGTSQSGCWRRPAWQRGKPDSGGETTLRSAHESGRNLITARSEELNRGLPDPAD
jgi:hypothetical protein